MRKLKLMSALLAGVIALSMALTGCKGNTTGGSSTGTDSKKEETVNLKFYMSNGPVKDLDRIMTKANAIIKEKINATLEFVMVDPATYAEKMNLMISSGDPFDLCFSAHWAGDFYQNASKGAYADLTDLIPKHAPKTYSNIPEGLWEGVKVNGKIYGTVNYQQWGAAARKGFTFRKDIAEETKFDWKAVKGKSTIEAMKLIGPFLGDALKKHPDMIGWETGADFSMFANEPLLWDMDTVGDTALPGWIRYTEPDKVINQFATPEFKEYCNIMQDWYKKGYVRKDGATLKDTTVDRKAAKLVAAVVYGWPDTIDCEEIGIMNDNISAMSMCTPQNAPAVSVSTTRTVLPANIGANCTVAISANSPNIVKSLELIELLNTDDELFYLIGSGEEGVDFTYAEDGTVTPVDGKYHFNYNEWQIGQSYSPTFSRATMPKGKKGEDLKKSMQVVFDADKTAEVSPLSGFIFNNEPVKTEIANCSAIIKECVAPLSNGCVDPAKKLPEFLKRLEDAGVNKIIEEKQKQIDAWKAATKK